MFKISDLTVKINDKKVLDNFNLQINNGEVHVIMGKNGTGKSTLCKVILNDGNYEVISGNIIYNNKNLLEMAPYEIAREKISFISQNPISIEGVTTAELLRTIFREINNENINIFEFNKKMEDICSSLELDKSFIHKEINVGASGGERKKVELLHMGMLEPKFIILDEIDSGLDVDALRIVAKFITEYHEKSKCSILLITHHLNIINYIKPNFVHVLDEGNIVKTGDYNLAKQIEKSGFSGTNIICESDKNE